MMASPRPSGVMILTHPTKIKKMVEIQESRITLLLTHLEAAVSVLKTVGHSDPFSSLPTTDLSTVRNILVVDNGTYQVAALWSLCSTPTSINTIAKGRVTWACTSQRSALSLHVPARHTNDNCNVNDTSDLTNIGNGSRTTTLCRDSTVGTICMLDCRCWYLKFITRGPLDCVSLFRRMHLNFCRQINSGS